MGSISNMIFLCFMLQFQHSVTICTSRPEGALITTEFTAQVGFLIDETNDLNDLNKRTEFFIENNVSNDDWIQLAKFQIKHTRYRQVYRRFYNGQSQLTLPPVEKWEITFTDSRPIKQVIQGHSYLLRNYRFVSVLVARADDIYKSEEILTVVNGSFTESFMVPMDPQHMLQRTGYACANEAGFQIDTVDSQNFWTYYDAACGAEDIFTSENFTYDKMSVRCHLTAFPNESCSEVLQKNVGYTFLNITWKRIDWSDSIADHWRYGETTSRYIDLKSGHNLEEDLKIVYKFFANDSCVLEEADPNPNPNLRKGGCIGKPGWRRLLEFTSTQINVGAVDMFLGNISAEFLSKGIFVFHSCHQHYHFQHYGAFKLDNIPARKVGFCLQSTWRYFNNEWTSLNNAFDTCTYQGIAVGWGDDYYSGIDCQWFDITDVEPGVYNLTDQLNPDGFICEGKFIMDQYNQNIFEPTNYTFNGNQTVYKQKCEQTEGFTLNNLESVNVNITQADSIVSMPCKFTPQLDSRKDCGFTLAVNNQTCNLNQMVEISFQDDSVTVGGGIVIRICEFSIELNQAIYCEYQRSVATQLFVVEHIGAVYSMSFMCPSARSTTEIGGRFAVFASNFIPGDSMPKLKNFMINHESG